jgi:hypothetical protein
MQLRLRRQPVGLCGATTELQIEIETELYISADIRAMDMDNLPWH